VDKSCPKSTAEPSADTEEATAAPEATSTRAGAAVRPVGKGKRFVVPVISAMGNILVLVKKGNSGLLFPIETSPTDRSPFNFYLIFLAEHLILAAKKNIFANEQFTYALMK
jgi:hypothetical protein